MSLDLDFLTQVTNVSWTGGLAVEFTERPDYLTMNHALSMNKVVISFWFFVPTESAKAMQARPFWEYQVFNGVIPIITWGTQQFTPVSEVQRIDTGAMEGTGGGTFAHGSFPIILDQIGGLHTAPMQPSTIGVRVGSPKDTPTLHVHIQTNVKASGTGLFTIQTAFTGTFVGHDVDSGKPVYGGVEYTNKDVSYMITEEPDYFGNSDSNSSGSGAGNPKVTLNKWHHLLISWELKSMSNLGSSFSKMWCAIDDKNKNGPDLPAMNDPSVMGPNDHMSWMPWEWQGDAHASVNISFGSNDVPSNPFQIPAPPSVKRATDEQGGTVSIAPIVTVELAELQIFSGVTLDASNEVNRRAFIDYEKDDEGKPIVDENGKRTLKPVNPKQAEKLLGKKPDILLHGTQKWQQGKNTGSLGIDDEGETIPSGQFTPTGDIKQYKPDPSIIET